MTVERLRWAKMMAIYLRPLQNRQSNTIPFDGICYLANIHLVY